MTKKILGVKIDDVSKEKGLKIVEGWLVSSRPSAGSPKKIAAVATLPRNDKVKLIFTPGPEFLVTAQNDPEFKKILNAGDLNLPDGYGLKIFAGIIHVVPGVEFMLALCQLAAEKGWTVGLVGRRFVFETASELIKRYPKIKIEVIKEGHSGLDNCHAEFISASLANASGLLKQVERSRNKFGMTPFPSVDLLFVGLGHPEQEKFLYNCKLNIAHCSFRVGMGVGGSFDFISGQVAEPGTIYKRLGLKWLGRFLSRPGYMFPKILKAVVLFPLLLLKEKFS